jgi:hypothetical protein
MSEQLARLNPLTECSSLSFRTFTYSNSWLLFTGWLKRFREYRIVIWNSIEPVQLVKWIPDVSVPTLVVVHNPHFLKRAPAYRRRFAKQCWTPILLAPWAVNRNSWLRQPVAVFPAYFCGGRPASVDKVGQQQCTFCVQGSLEFHRRNYAALLHSATELQRRGRHFKIMVNGSLRSPDYVRFRESALEAGLIGLFDFPCEPHLSYREFFDRLGRVAFICALLDHTRDSYSAYFTNKASSFFPISLGAGIVPIVHRDLAQLYGIEDGALTHGDGDLFAAMDAALSLSESALAKLQARLRHRRQKLLEDSVSSLRNFLDGCS